MKKLVCTFLVGMMLFFLTACLIRPINRDNIPPDTFYSQELGVGVRLDMNKKTVDEICGEPERDGDFYVYDGNLYVRYYEGKVSFMATTTMNDSWLIQAGVTADHYLNEITEMIGDPPFIDEQGAYVYFYNSRGKLAKNVGDVSYALIIAPLSYGVNYIEILYCNEQYIYDTFNSHKIEDSDLEYFNKNSKTEDAPSETQKPNNDIEKNKQSSEAIYDSVCATLIEFYYEENVFDDIVFDYIGDIPLIKAYVNDYLDVNPSNGINSDERSLMIHYANFIAFSSEIVSNLDNYLVVFYNEDGKVIYKVSKKQAESEYFIP